MPCFGDGVAISLERVLMAAVGAASAEMFAVRVDEGLKVCEQLETESAMKRFSNRFYQGFDLPYHAVTAETAATTAAKWRFFVRQFKGIRK
jgi:hypothetical protein